MAQALRLPVAASLEPAACWSRRAASSRRGQATRCRVARLRSTIWSPGSGAPAISERSAPGRHPTSPSSTAIRPAWRFHLLQRCRNVHAADDLSVMETLSVYPAVIASAKKLCPDKPIWLGPCTIGMRHNPYGAAVAANPGLVRLPAAGDDPRHGALSARPSPSAWRRGLPQLASTIWSWLHRPAASDWRRSRQASPAPGDSCRAGRGSRRRVLCRCDRPVGAGGCHVPWGGVIRMLVANLTAGEIALDAAGSGCARSACSTRRARG